MKNNQAICSIKPHDTFLEQKKNEFLAAVYEADYQAVEIIYKDILQHAETRSKFSENFEKHLNQIQVIFKKFIPAILQHHTLPGIEKANKRLAKIISTAVRQSSSHVDYVDFLSWETNLGLGRKQKELLYKTAMTFQLSSGCSNFCRRCNEWALPGVRSHFSFDAVQKIIDRMAKQENTEISLYGASDPLDWSGDKKSIYEIVEYLEKTPVDYYLLTKVPKGKEALLKRLLKSGSNLSVSVTSKNKTRVSKIEEDLGSSISKQHDLDDLLIPAGLEEDFVSIKPSITDGYGTEITPDGAFIIIPSFTSAVYPFGHKKIPVTSETWFFPMKKTGRKALLVDYFKPLEGYDLDQNKCHLGCLLDVQVESIILDNGTDDLVPPGMRSLKEYLSIFDEKARLQRKKMRLTILKRLKKQFLLKTSFKNLSLKIKSLYLKKLNSHLDLCKAENCLKAKLYALSFFLESIHHYQQKYPIKLKLMRFLLKDEVEFREKSCADPAGDSSFKDIFNDPCSDSFDMFRSAVFCLLASPGNAAVLSFIKTHPSKYDPDADIFVPS